MDAKTGEKTGNMKIPPAQSLQMIKVHPVTVRSFRDVDVRI
jgi:hypothetical protein